MAAHVPTRRAGRYPLPFGPIPLRTAGGGKSPITDLVATGLDGGGEPVW